MSKYDHSQSPIHIILHSWENVNSLTITSMTPLLEICSVIKLACQLLDASRYYLMLCRYLLPTRLQILYVWLLVYIHKRTVVCLTGCSNTSETNISEQNNCERQTSMYVDIHVYYIL